MKSKEEQLLKAIINDETAQALEIIESGSVDIEVRDDFQRTPLMLAAFQGNADLVQALIKKGAKVNVCDENLETPLMLSCAKISEGHDAAQKLLIRAGASGNAINKFGQTHIDLLKEKSRRIENDRFGRREKKFKTFLDIYLENFPKNSKKIDITR